MYHSLNLLKQLPLKTKVYCSHEYTLRNAQFALEVDPDNALLQQRLQEVCALRAKNQITLPTTIERERQTNPFFRTKNLNDFFKKRLLKDHY
jgi:hydroxyacylglutathione hydrolase